MMKSISIFVALMALLFADIALAAGAVATSVTGTVTVQTGTAAARPLRQGDTVSQGDTVVTAASSSAVLRFDDGEITALTANSRLAVTAYQYNPTNNAGNVFLSLLSGGMRAITGLIGRSSPNNVAYRAATATIGIRGTTVDVVTGDNDVAVSVVEGSITFSDGKGNTYTVSAGEAVFSDRTGKITRSSAAAILGNLPPALRDAFSNLKALEVAINMSNANAGAGESKTVGTTTITSTGTGSSTGGGGASVQ